jgi:predicted nucleotidyltransferase
MRANIALICLYDPQILYLDGPTIGLDIFAKEKMNIKFPTIHHKNYIEYIKNFCNVHQISLLLYGSLMEGTATKFSDIDLVIYGNLNEDLLDKLILGYSRIVMTNYTEKPKGIFILNYCNFICVDLDIRDTVLISELKNFMILCDFGWKIETEKIRKSITSNLLPPRPEWYKTLRLIHRCALKYLCKKNKIVSDLLTDIIRNTKEQCNVVLSKNESTKLILSKSLSAFEIKYRVDNNIIDMFHGLFEFM